LVPFLLSRASAAFAELAAQLAPLPHAPAESFTAPLSPSGFNAPLSECSCRAANAFHKATIRLPLGVMQGKTFSNLHVPAKGYVFRYLRFGSSEMRSVAEEKDGLADFF